MPARFIDGARHLHFPPHPRFPVAHPHQHLNQLDRINPIRFGPAGAAIDLEARRIDYTIPDPAPHQRPMDPEPVASGFIATHHVRGRRQPASLPPRAQGLIPAGPVATPYRPQDRRHTKSRRHGQLPLGFS
jgi:hypothetical protein